MSKSSRINDDSFIDGSETHSQRVVGINTNVSQVSFAAEDNMNRSQRSSISSHLLNGREDLINSAVAQHEKQALLSWTTTLVEVIKAGVPTILSLIFFQMIGLLNVWFIGQLDNTVLLGAVGMGTMLINVFCFALVMGLNGSIETFVSHAYGNENWQMCGETLNRARIIITLILLPVFIMFVWADSILISIGQDPEVSLLARQYCCCCIPGIVGFAQFDSTKRFLQSMLKSSISTQVQVTTSLLHILWCILFINVAGWGLYGAAIALNVTYLSQFVLQELYIRVYKKKDFEHLIAPLFNKKSLTGWWEFLKMGIPSTAMQCFEWWAFEIIAIFAGWLGKEQLAAQVAVINVVTLIYMLPLGMQFAASGLVGNEIGKRNVAQAQRFAIVCILFTLGMTVVICSLFIVFDYQVATLFSKEPVVVGYVMDTLPILCVYLFFDAIHGVQSGNVRALGRQFTASIVLLACYYVAGLPIALILGFKAHMGVKGFWLGFLIALIIMDAILGYLVVSADWSPELIKEEPIKKTDDDFKKTQPQTTGRTEKEMLL